MRLGPGPVFVFEWIVSARRWQVYALRAGFVLGLLAAMVVTWISQVQTKDLTTIRAQAAVGEYYFYALVGTQLALVMLVAPAFTAGAICLDRERGALAHVLVTDLSDAEIVLGKLGARLIPVVGLAACAVPVMSLGALLGGIDPFALAMAFLVTLAVATLSGVLALTISVWARKTHEALMAVYVLWALAMSLHWIWTSLASAGVVGPSRWALRLNPFWLGFSPYFAPNEVVWSDFALFVGGSLGLAAALTAIAIVRLRPVTAQLAGQSSRVRRPRSRLGRIARLGRLLPGPSLDHNPVLWREWHRYMPSRLTRLIWWAYFASISYAGVVGVYEVCFGGANGLPMPGEFVFVFLATAVGLLLLSVTASTSLSDERTRGSLDVLLATPLRTRTIVLGKWFGAYRVVPLLAFWPTVVMAAIAYVESRGLVRSSTRDLIGNVTRAYPVVLMALIFLVHGAAITSLGLALATWIRRQSRAVALCVAAYLMVSIGWVILFVVLFPRGPRNLELFLCLSPLFASGYLCESVARGGHETVWVCFITSVWLVVVAGAAAALYAATLATFDRSFCRASDWNDELWFGPESGPNGNFGRLRSYHG